LEAKDILVIGVSSLALITSAVSFVSTFRQRALENKRGIRKSLTDALGELAEVALTRAKLDLDHPELSDQIMTLRRMYNSQRRHIAMHAEYLVRQIPDLATDIDYNLLAGTFHAIGDYDKTQHYWELCVKASENKVVRAMNLRGFARFLFFQGNQQLGRKRYQESLELELPDTDNIRRDRTDTYSMWAKTESDFGFIEEARRLKDQALSTAKRIGHVGMREEITSYIGELLGSLDAKDSPSVG
jgi:tetratricopeptide (TPR) repeat protein